MNAVGRAAWHGGSSLSWFVDAGVATVVVVMFWVLPWFTQPDAPGVTALAPAAVVVVAVLTRWRWPLAMSMVALLATAAGWMLGASTDPMLATAWCLYPLALRRQRRSTPWEMIVVAVLVVGSGVLAVTSASGGPSAQNLAQRVVVSVGAVGAAWLMGHAEARRLATSRQMAEQVAEAERMRSQATMAREVHDVVGHSLAVIRAEADVALSLPDADEQELRESMSDIERRAGGALEEVQALVRALREGTEPLAALEPEPASAALPRLMAAARAGGLEVTANINLPHLSPQTEHVTVRVVQEALSNVVRHAAANSCDVAVWPDGTRLTVQIDDDGAGLPSAMRPGSGLAGMRERVVQAGGELTVTNRPGGGTRVLARFPMGAGS